MRQRLRPEDWELLGKFGAERLAKDANDALGGLLVCLDFEAAALRAERDRLAALVGGYETAIIRFVRLHEGEDDELGRGVCDVGILRAALAAGKGVEP